MALILLLASEAVGFPVTILHLGVVLAFGALALTTVCIAGCKSNSHRGY